MTGNDVLLIVFALASFNVGIVVGAVIMRMHTLRVLKERRGCALTSGWMPW